MITSLTISCGPACAHFMVNLGSCCCWDFIGEWRRPQPPWPRALNGLEIDCGACSTAARSGRRWRSWRDNYAAHRGPDDDVHFGVTETFRDLSADPACMLRVLEDHGGLKVAVRVQPGSELKVAGLEPAGFLVDLENIHVHPILHSFPSG